MKKLTLICLMLAVIQGCASNCQTYVMGEKMDGLVIKVCSEGAVDRECSKRLSGGYVNKTGAPGKVVGFYSPSENIIYTSRNFDVLLHEIYHASGHLEEPPWEK